MSFTTSEKWLAHETLKLKSNFDLIEGKFMECCTAVKNFRKFILVERLLFSYPFFHTYVHARKCLNSSVGLIKSWL